MKTKNIFLAGFVGMSLILTSCGEQAPAPVVEVAAPVKKLAVDTLESKVNWKGSVLGMHSHEGFVIVKNGMLEYQGDSILSGEFVIDLAGMQAVDSAYSKDKTKEMLIGHLSSPEFFDTKMYPTATFKITGMVDGNVEGMLMLKGKENKEVIKDVVLTEANGVTTATGKLTLNRQNYGVSYKSTMKDVVLSDDIELNIALVVKG